MKQKQKEKGMSDKQKESIKKRMEAQNKIREENSRLAADEEAKRKQAENAIEAELAKKL
jgi:hypothetical protein